MYSIVAHYFDGEEKWDTLAKGFKKSVLQNTNAILNLSKIDKPEADKARWKLTANNHKLKIWRDAVHSASMPIVLMDADIIVLKDIADGFKSDITLTDNGKKWVNGGVIFVNPTQKSKDFFDAWVEADSALYNTEPLAGNPRGLIKAWSDYKVKGCNQTSLRTIYDDWKEIIEWVPCQTYNACRREQWIEPQRVVHVMEPLQSQVLKTLGGGRPDRLKELVKKLLPYYL